MKHISSRDNPMYKALRRLAGGRADGQAMLEGVHLCQEWLARRGPPRLAVFDAGRLAGSAELQALARALPPALCLGCDAALMRGLSRVEHGQGVHFVVTVPEPEPPARVSGNSLWLDRVQDPGNVGTLLRTAAAAGISDVYLSAGCASAWSPKVLRSAQGAHFTMRLHERQDLAALAGRLDVPLLAAALDDAVSLYEADLPEHCAWLIGNEGQGIAPVLLALAAQRVFVPQAEGVESLNAAVAAAICLFEQRRRRLAQEGACR